MRIEPDISNIRPRKIPGFTLIELVMTIALIAIIFSITGIFIGNSIRAYADISIRSSLVDSAEIAIRRMERDIHRALPNSIRVKVQGTRTAIEMVNVVEGLRYRAQGPGAANDILTMDTTDSQFNVLTPFSVAALGNNGYRLVIYNTGASGASSDNPTAGQNVYSLSTAPGPNPPAGSHVITPAGTTVTLSNPGAEGRVVLSVPFQFAFQSPQQRIYVIDTPITYLCDTSAGTITQYSNYSLLATQATNPAAFPLSAATPSLLTKNLVACSFAYTAGTSQRNSIVTIQITIGQGTEQVRLIHQVGVSNAP